MSITTATRLELTHDLSAAQAESMLTPYPEFEALRSVPHSLGFSTHGRLEEILGTPIASSDAQPMGSNDETGQRSGFALGDTVGRNRVFTDNIPAIKGDIKRIAEERGVTENDIWEEIHTVVEGSGITQPMYRTLDRPLGGAYGLRDHLSQHADNGITFLVRGNIANWHWRRQLELTKLLGGLPVAVLQNVHSIVYAGSGRPLKGPTELWRPEIAEFGTHEVPKADGGGVEEVSNLTEKSANEKFYAPRTRELLGRMSVLDKEIPVVTTGLDLPVSGDDVTRSVIATVDKGITGRLIVEVGNAPAGYTQLSSGLILAKELGIEPSQFVAVSDGVKLARKDYFEKLSPAEKSRVQNVVTAWNSINGWLSAIVAINTYMLEKTTPSSTNI